jgi:ribosomal protein L7/L12
MATQVREAGEFSLIITEGNPSAAGDLAQAFSLDEAIAGQVLNAVPIIFVSKLTKSEVKAITPKLVELSKSGLAFRVTARVPNKVPKVHWPTRPQFTVAGSGSAVGLAFDMENNAFVCPGCGEAYLFKRLGQVKLAEPAAEASAPAAAAAPAPAAKAAPAPVAKAAPVPVKAAAKPAAVAAKPVIEEETIDLAEDDVVPPEPEKPAGDDLLPGEGEPIELAESVEEIKLDDLPDAPGGGLGEAAEEASNEAAAEAEQEAPPEGTELFNVFLSKINDKSKQDKAAEMISKIKGCSLSEAKELTSRMIIPISKNVTKEQAEETLNGFKKIKVFGRMTKVK